mmetsp:Transcript_14917/g.33285  ORF Transcript_14917/g.33285 Transcript_14917/m.33285 type:complete len:224 (-) Transcript_14917:355-1026(-)
MNAEDLYWDREDLMTPEELEELNHSPSDETIPTYTPNMRAWLIDNHFEGFPRPDAEYKREFLKRKPAMGASADILAEIRVHNALLPAVQQRKLFNSLRGQMLRQLIPCPGAKTVEELCGLLEAELDSGVPAPVPEWYEFSTVRFGPRRIGYEPCGARGCFQTETTDSQFGRCTRCKLVYYCGKECQASDWKARHKKVCKKGAQDRDKTEKVSQFISMFADRMG